MKKSIIALLVLAFSVCLAACGNSQSVISSGQEYVGVWKRDTLMFSLDGESWHEQVSIVLNADGTAIYRGTSTTWEYNDKYGKYGTIEIALGDKDTESLIIAEENGQRVLRQDVGLYYRETEFPVEDH